MNWVKWFSNSDNWMVIGTLLLACAAFAQFELGRRTAKRQLRAYIFIAEGKIIGMDTDDPQAEITIKNSGQTPAYKVVVSTAANTADVGNRPDFHPVAESENSSRFLFGADGMGRRNIPLKVLLPVQAKRDALKAGLGILYVWGEIHYKDIFNHDRWVKFRLEIGGKNAWPTDDRMFVCPEGNDSGDLRGLYIVIARFMRAVPFSRP